MKAIIKLDDNLTLEIEAAGKEGKELLHEAITYSQFPKTCVCGNTEELYFTTNKDLEGNVYVNVKCPKCGATSKLGSLKAGGYFWHRFEVYVPKVRKEALGDKELAEIAEEIS